MMYHPKSMRLGQRQERRIGSGAEIRIGDFTRSFSSISASTLHNKVLFIKYITCLPESQAGIEVLSGPPIESRLIRILSDGVRAFGGDDNRA
jgi:hypothetical protein